MSRFIDFNYKIFFAVIAVYPIPQFFYVKLTSIFSVLKIVPIFITKTFYNFTSFRVVRRMYLISVITFVFYFRYPGFA